MTSGQKSSVICDAYARSRGQRTPVTHHEFLGGGIPFADETVDYFVDLIFSHARDARPLTIFTPNIQHFQTLYSRPYDEYYSSADLYICDSRVVAAIAKVHSIHLNVVPGSDLTKALLNDQRAKSTSILIVGPDAATFESVKCDYQLDAARLLEVGWIDRNEKQIGELARTVSELRWDILLICFSHPKPEMLASALSALGVSQPVLCVGASIDFLVGRQRRAPLILQALGLEWAYRLAANPSRLWRRYLLEGPPTVLKLAYSARNQILSTKAKSMTKFLVDVSATRPTQTGIEVAGRQFLSAFQKTGANVEPVESHDPRGFLVNQLVRLPLKLLGKRYRRAFFPTFPPSPITTVLFRNVVVPTVHDLFLLKSDGLAAFAKLYMAPSFKLMLWLCQEFIVDSEHVRGLLSTHVGPSKPVHVCRPSVANRFGLAYGQFNRQEPAEVGSFNVVMIGTVEPRKGYSDALAVAAQLQGNLGLPVVVNVIGRGGWGDLGEQPRDVIVKFHGYLSETEARQVIAGSHMAWFASHDEGLGLPPLEVAYSGIPIALSDIPAFAETLGGTGHVINWREPKLGAAQVVEALEVHDETRSHATFEKVGAWNEKAHADVIRIREYYDR